MKKYDTLTIGHISLDYNIDYQDNQIIEVDQALTDGKHVIFGMTEGFNLFSSDDLDGNGKLDDLVYEDVGFHGMEVVESLGDGKYIVSSWGNKYILDSRSFHDKNIKSKIFRMFSNDVKNCVEEK